MIEQQDASSKDQLKRTISLLDAVIESTADGILVVDRDGKIVHFNKKFARMWRIPEEILESRDDNRAIAFVLDQLKEPEQFVQKVRELYNNPEATSSDLLEFKDGRVFERYSQPQKLGDEFVGRVWSFRCVTEQKKMERERANVLSQEHEARRSAERAVAMRDDFLSMAAHELKTPLTALKMQTQLIHRLLSDAAFQHPRAEGLRKVLCTSEKQLEQFLKLVDDMLNASRAGAGKLSVIAESVDLSEVVRNVIERYQFRLTEAQCSIKLEAPGPVRGEWDPLRLEEVIVNLLTNAAKYGAGKPIEISVRQDGETARLTVRDHGIGIAKGDQERIFERFERATNHKNFRGFGLGLFITRQIVEAHGGRIWVESELGKGSIFTVELPLDGVREHAA